MKALYFEHHGSINNLKYGDLPDPILKPGEALVKVSAAALNHLDLWVLAGWPGLKLPLPHVGGSDVAGTVVGYAGAARSDLPVGSKVVLQPGFATVDDEWTRRDEDSLSPNYQILAEHRWGGFAELIAVPASAIYPLPPGFSFAQASAPLLSALTAWRMLAIRAELQPGETVLIVGAGGGVNSVAIEIAKLLGARVIALSSSEAKLEQSKKLGADDTINYLAEKEWSKTVRNLTNRRGVDVVVDNVGKATYLESFKALCRGGRLVTVGNTSGAQFMIDNRYIFGKQLTVLGSTMGSKKDFEKVLQLLSDGSLKPVIDREIPLEHGQKGYEIMEAGEQFGKIVLTV
jgi:NADPH:quinone reductase-like Zn-dependent oxidoreductase